MDKRFWLWLLLPLLFSPGTASAQSSRYFPPPTKQSHYPLPGELDLDNAQEMMAERLKELQELHQLQDQVQELLKDPKFRDEIDKLSKSPDFQGLREKLLKGEGLSPGQNRIWEKLLEHARTRKLGDEQIGILSRWAQRAEHKQPSSESETKMPDNAAEATPAPPMSPPTGSAALPPSRPTPTEPGPSVIDQLQEKSMKWLMENFEDVSGDMLQALTEVAGKEGSTALAETLRSLPQSDFSGINSEHPLLPALRRGGLSRYLSDAGDFFQGQSGLWDKVGSLFTKAPLPSLSNVGSPSVSMRTPSTTESEGWLPALLSLLMLGLIVLFICKRGFGPKERTGAGADEEWRLGSWPVSPGAVSTRQDVIRAFEYLALLCFGPAAAACHHRQLAQRLADQDNANPARRQAAEMLAWLYEQSRYAPAGETLSPEQLSDARQALCSLAGVATA